jgi:hypothetical protein
LAVEITSLSNRERTHPLKSPFISSLDDRMAGNKPRRVLNKRYQKEFTEDLKLSPFDEIVVDYILVNDLTLKGIVLD